MTLFLLYAELRRRRVLRVAAYYVLAGWAVITLAYFARPALGLPAWTVRLVVALVMAGFAPAVLLTWAFDITPKGLVRTPPAGSNEPPQPARPMYTTVLAALTLWALTIGAYAKYELEHLPAPFWGATVASNVDSIVVLPFEDDAARDHYFSSGISEELAIALGSLPAVRVSASHLSIPVPGLDARSVDRASRTAVLSGSVRRYGSNLRVSAQLNAADGSPLWTQVYDATPADIFHLQDEIRRGVLRTLRPDLRRRAYPPAPAPPTASLEAYDLYLRGRWLVQMRAPDSLLRARAVLERAVELDPGFARAHAALASVHVLLPLYTAAEPVTEFRRATELAERALALDTTLAEPHAARAFAYLHTGNAAASVAGYQRALALEPGFAPAHHWYAWALLALGRQEDALAQLRDALQLDQRSLVIRASLGAMLYRADRYADAVAALQTVLELDPEFHLATAILAVTHAVHGDLAAALPHALRIQSLPGRSPFERAAAAYVLARAGRAADARVVAEQLEQAHAWALAARVHMALGDTASVYTALGRAAARRDPYAAHELVGDPIFAPLRDSPQFVALRQSMGLP